MDVTPNDLGGRPVKSHHDLIVWQRAMQLVKETYIVTRGFPAEEVYGIVSQLRRAAVSVPCNIAERQARRTGREFAQFLCQARGSLMEVDTLVRIAISLGYLAEDRSQRILALVNGTGQLLNGLLNALRRSEDPLKGPRREPRATSIEPRASSH